jgi:DNA cross-link repair 1C protein
LGGFANALCPDISIESLFGQYCSGNIFAHDIKVNNFRRQNIQPVVNEQDTQRQESCSSSVPSLADQASPRMSHAPEPRDTNPIFERDISALQREFGLSNNYKERITNSEKPTEPFEEQIEDESLLAKEWPSQCHTEKDGENENDSQNTATSLTSVLSMRHSSTRFDAYERMLQNCRGADWNSIELISTGCNHSTVEQEL